MKQNAKAPQALTAGYYGKVPTQGDFVTRGFSRGQTNMLDEWLRLCVRESQRMMGRGWLDAFLVAPVWRMAITPGIVGPDGFIGVMMPSVDRAGRYFPLLIGCNLIGQTCNADQMRGLTPWYNAAEELALSTLSQSFTLAEFDEQIKTLLLPTSLIPEGETAPQPKASQWWTAQQNRSVISFPSLPAPETFAESFLAPPPTESPPSNTKPTLPAPIVMPTRTPHTASVGSVVLKSPYQAEVTDVVQINEDKQALSLLNAIGRHANARAAVRQAAETIAAIENPFSMSDLIASAKGRLGMANTLLYARSLAGRDPVAIASVTLLLQAQFFSVLWVGNARAYLFRNGTLSLLTRDHADLRLPSMVTRAIGAAGQLRLDQVSNDVMTNDRFLLCSGSVTSVLSDADLSEIIASGSDPNHVARAIAQDAMIAGAQKDVSAIIAFVS